MYTLRVWSWLRMNASSMLYTCKSNGIEEFRVKRVKEYARIYLVDWNKYNLRVNGYSVIGMNTRYRFVIFKKEFSPMFLQRPVLLIFLLFTFECLIIVTFNSDAYLVLANRFSKILCLFLLGYNE